MSDQQERAERQRERYAASAAARESAAKFRNGFLTVALIGMGVLTVGASVAGKQWWGVGGGIVILLGVLPLRWASRHQTFETERGLTRNNAMAMAAVALALVLFMVGALLTKHPWS